MRKYTRKFYGRMLIFAGGFAALAVLLMQTIFDRITIDHAENVLIWYIVLPLIFAGALALFCHAMAVHHTNVLRRYEYSASNETVFYICFAVIVTLAAAGEIIFLMSKLLPFLEKAHSFALKDAEIKNETLSMREDIISRVNELYSVYRTAAFAGAGAAFAVRAVCAALSARKLIKVYRDPPDYWSGRKKSQAKKK